MLGSSAPLDRDLAPFDFEPRTRVVYGPGTLERVGDLVGQTGRRRVLLVTDPGIRQVGHAARCQEILNRAGFATWVFEDVQPNPTTDDVDRGLAVAKAHDIDVLVAIGGGSSMDCAKGINFLLTNGGRMQDYWGVGKATRPMLPLVAIPTTAGTGSEAQSFALIADAQTHVKMACGDKKAACFAAILDPQLTSSMPRSVAAATGIDALSHAVESYVTTKRTAVSALFSRQAWSYLARAFPVTMSATASEAERLTAQGAMLVGAHWAGAAIENSMLGATHALANPLTAEFDLTHGIAIGLLLPAVIEYNAVTAAGWYGDLAADIGICAADDPAVGTHLGRFVRELVALSGCPTRLSAVNVPRESLPRLAAAAAKQWTAAFNPRPVDVTSLQALYEAAF